MPTFLPTGTMSGAVQSGSFNLRPCLERAVMSGICSFSSGRGWKPRIHLQLDARQDLRRANLSGPEIATNHYLDC